MPTINELKQSIGDAFLSEPQKQKMAIMALEAIDAGITQLASLGHQYVLGKLAHEEAAQANQYPKMVYSDHIAPGHAIAENKIEEDRLLADGWRLTPLAPSVVVQGEELSPNSTVPVAQLNTKDQYIKVDGEMIENPHYKKPSA
jgi:hypothetical protein